MVKVGSRLKYSVLEVVWYMLIERDLHIGRENYTRNSLLYDIRERFLCILFESNAMKRFSID